MKYDEWNNEDKENEDFPEMTGNHCPNCADTLMTYVSKNWEILFCTNCDFYMSYEYEHMRTFNKGSKFKRVH